MDIYFCKGKSLMSKVIAALDDTDVSHVALSSPGVGGNNLMFHSVTSGVKICTRAAFNRKFDVKRVYRLESSHKNEADLLWHLISNYEDRPYDFNGIAYLGLFLMANRVGIKLPKKNIWQNRNYFICTEFVSLGIFGKPDSMLTLRSLETLIQEKSRYERLKIY
jgi:hypothetical protein